MVITGLPGSGKTTISKSLKIETISTDEQLKILKEKNQHFPNPSGISDDFRKHELKTIIHSILNGYYKDKTIDLGGAALLQPALASICEILKINIINLEINDEDRVQNLTHDAILLGEENFRKNTVRFIEENEKKEQFNNLSNEYKHFVFEHKHLATSREKLETFLSTHQNFAKSVENIRNHCREADTKISWRKQVYKRVAEPQTFDDALRSIKVIR